MRHRATWVGIMAAAVCISAQACDAGVELLKAVIRSDLAGDATARVGAEYSEQQQAMLAVDQYSLETDPVVVVDGPPQVIGDSTEPDKSCLKAKFRVLARSSGAGLPSWEREEGREIHALTPPQFEEVRYCALGVGGKWVLIDMPIPRVTKSAMVESLSARLARSARLTASVRASDPQAVKNMNAVRESLQRQLDVLLGL